MLKIGEHLENFYEYLINNTNYLSPINEEIDASFSPPDFQGFLNHLDNAKIEISKEIKVALAILYKLSMDNNLGMPILVDVEDRKIYIKASVSKNKKLLTTFSKLCHSKTGDTGQPNLKFISNISVVISINPPKMIIDGEIFEYYDDIVKSNASKSTQMQELSSAAEFVSVLNTGKSLEWDDFKKPNLYPTCPKEWVTVFHNQSAVLVEYLKNQGWPDSGYMCDRDGGMMQKSIDMIRPFFTSKDSWNPADVWLYPKKHETKIVEILTEATIIAKKKLEDEGKDLALEYINTVMRGFINEKMLLGISLKKTGKEAHKEENNFDGVILKFDDWSEVDLVKTRSKFDFEYSPKKGFNTKETVLAFNVTNIKFKEIVICQLKIGSKAARTSSTIELSSLKNKEARLGKVPTDLLDDFYGKFEKTRQGSKFIPLPGQWDDAKIDSTPAQEYFENIYKVAYDNFSKKIIMPTPRKFNITLNSAIIQEKPETRGPNKGEFNQELSSTLNSKLHAIYHLYVWSHFVNDPKLWQQFFIILYLGSKKNLPHNGPFLKIY